MAFELRPLSLTDAARLTEIHAAALPPGWDERSFSGFLTQTDGTAGLAAVEGGGVAGFLLWRLQGEEAEILTLAMDASFRRKGIAQRLMAEMERLLRMAGCERIFLEVAVDNDAALGFYQKAGFSWLSTRAGYYRRGEGSVDALILQKSLLSSR